MVANISSLKFNKSVSTLESSWSVSDNKNSHIPSIKCCNDIDSKSWNIMENDSVNSGLPYFHIIASVNKLFSALAASS